MSNTDVLFTPVQVGELTLPNRIVLAPLTRSRAGQPGNVPTPLMAEYYTQRAGAGLIISEATNISQIAMGYALRSCLETLGSSQSVGHEFDHRQINPGFAGRH